MLPRCAIHVRFLKLTGLGAVAWTVPQQLCTSFNIHAVIETFTHITLYCSSLESSLYCERIGFHQSFIHWKDENHTVWGGRVHCMGGFMILCCTSSNCTAETHTFWDTAGKLPPVGRQVQLTLLVCSFAYCGFVYLQNNNCGNVCVSHCSSLILSLSHLSARGQACLPIWLASYIDIVWNNLQGCW